ncbi:DUF928 domain-containing protein [Phormidium sp. FACHB-592]|uniref:DUF928 domain-containing protein n=1 Tax=Stenomitos frigidus AS-A4 TaxID=2933935 RepID=A0ABV0KQ13_9CYAN|nr:DUF928 domain-containing protein [Phormidium sp. FACHB-592]MBD2075398.1 DUF928 domain-containing protein [Phormidium sp. FACHB-592]
MLRLRKSAFTRQVAGALTTIALGLLMTASSAWAQAPDQKTIQSTQIIFNDPTPPQQGSPSGRQRGGASRGPCRQFEALTALVPTHKGFVWGQTVSDRPTFWFYLPNALTEKTPIEFVVQDAADNYIYNTRITAPDTKPGLIRLPIPATAKALEVGKAYTWTLSVYCDPAKPSSSVFVSGMVQRVASDATLHNRLKAATPLEQVRLYAEKGIWYNAVDTLAELYRMKPSDHQLTSTWITLLKQAKLGNLTTAPFSPCCTPKW